ncbi:MAG: alcohol dehydrogenase catalytic domain-containing protein [Candidatus Tritonobacter lacicola]|nr:alcohol dehydrogenase catalytic domain-containing protein [Candidatus Tritonobacter lacicola]
MRALIYDGELRLVEDYPAPEIGEGEALVRVLMAGICNTDLEIIKGYMGFTGVPGHEFVGVVEASPEEELAGKRVVGEINCPCGTCDYCLTGMGNHCPARSVLGILKRDGAFAEYLTLPVENLHIVPDGVRDEEAVFAEPLAAACRALEQVKLERGESVVVLGDGKLGLLVAQVVKSTGCALLSVGLDPSKLSILRGMGIRTRPGTDGMKEKFDVAVDCTGSPEGLGAALSLTRPLGRVVLKTTVAENPSIDTSRIVVDEITVIGSRCGPFEPALEALKAKTVKVEPLISAVVPFSNALEAFDIARKKDMIKVLLKM